MGRMALSLTQPRQGRWQHLQAQLLLQEASQADRLSSGGLFLPLQLRRRRRLWLLLRLLALLPLLLQLLLPLQHLGNGAAAARLEQALWGWSLRDHDASSKHVIIVVKHFMFALCMSPLCNI